MRAESRRHFLHGSLALASLGLLAGCGVLSPAAPQPRIARVGLLWPGSSDDSESQRQLESFRQGMHELGYLEGQHVALDVRWADGQADRQPELVRELLRLDPAVLLVQGNTAMRAVRQVSTTIPVVAAGLQDPVADGFAVSLGRPGGNVTGLTNISSQLAGKRLELLKETLPTTSRVAMLGNSAATSTTRTYDETRVAAHVLGVQLHLLGVRDVGELVGAFETAARSRTEALIVVGDSLLNGHRARIAELANRGLLPTMYNGREGPSVGGLFGYGPNLVANNHRAATYVDKILKGAQPGELPIEGPTVFDFVINLGTARALGLTIPAAVLQQGTEIIQ